MLRKILVFSTVLLIAGCTATDKLADSPVGYVPDLADRVAAVEWSEAQVETMIAAGLARSSRIPAILVFLYF